MKGKLTFEPILERTGSEIRFKPTLTSYGQTLKAAQELESNYENWKIQNGGSDILLVSPTRKTNVQIKHDSIIYSSEKSGGISDLESTVTKAVDIVLNQGKVDTLRHVGFRRTVVYKSQVKLEELFLLLKEKFYAPSTEDQVDKVRDLQVVLDGDIGSLLFHIRFGPMTFREAVFNFGSPYNKDEVEIPEENVGYIYADIDVYTQEELTRSKAVPLILEAAQENTKLIQSYLKRLEV